LAVNEGDPGTECRLKLFNLTSSSVSPLPKILISEKRTSSPSSAVQPPNDAKEGTMKIERSQLFAITSILDRNGKRVGNYLVDRSKDSLDREKREKRRDPEEEEAVVIHGAEADVAPVKGADVELKAVTGSTSLNITV
jgi:hypothetical protein